VCVGSFRDELLTLSNSGGCPLTITGIVSSSPEFIPPGVHAYPLVIAAGSSANVEVRFQPTSFGPKSAILTVSSDDPAGPRTLAISGFTPSGKLAITGTGHFGKVDLGRRAERTLSICNVGKCDLQVLKVAFLPDPWKPGCHDCDGCGGDCGCGCHGHGHGSHGHEHGHEGHHDDKGHDGHHKDNRDQCCATFKIASNPFPATVRPGSCLPVLIRFTPTCAGPKCCELVVETNDPDAPRTIVYVTGSMHRTLRSALKCWAAEELQSLLKAGKNS
jgi:hypothetical protein